MVKFLRHGYGEFDAARAIGPAEWPHHDLFFVHHGRVRIDFPGLGREIELKRGMGVLIWPHTGFEGYVCGARARASIHHFRVEAGVSFPFRRLLGQRDGISRQLARPSRWLENCIERSQEIVRTPARGREAGLSSQLLLALVLAEGGYLAEECKREVPKRIDLVALEIWLRENFPRRPGIDGMAGRVGLSPSRFRTVFLAEHGMTAGEFLLSVREAEARRFLVETAEPLKRIAGALGYADAVVLNRAFKQRTGMTPAAFRRRQRIVG